MAAFVYAITTGAQTDCTSYITNPSFEQGTDGWEHKGMNAQGNSVFSIKDGNTYMERWTGRGEPWAQDGWRRNCATCLPATTS